MHPADACSSAPPTDRRPPGVGQQFSSPSPLLARLLSGSVIFLFCHTGTEIFIYRVITIAVSAASVRRCNYCPGGEGPEEEKGKSDISAARAGEGEGGWGARDAALIADRIIDCAEIERRSRHSRPGIELFPIPRGCERSGLSVFVYSDWSIMCMSVDASKKDSTRRNNFMDIYIYISVVHSPVRSVARDRWGSVGVNIKHPHPA